MSGSLLMPWENEFKVWRVVDGIEDWEDGAARIPNYPNSINRIVMNVQSVRPTNMLNALSLKHFVKYIAACHVQKTKVPVRSATRSSYISRDRGFVVTYDSSIAGVWRFNNGCTSFLLDSWLNAGLGTSLD